MTLQDGVVASLEHVEKNDYVNEEDGNIPWTDILTSSVRTYNSHIKGGNRDYKGNY